MNILEMLLLFMRGFASLAFISSLASCLEVSSSNFVFFLMYDAKSLYARFNLLERLSCPLVISSMSNE